MKDVEQAIEYQKYLSKNHMQTTSTISTDSITTMVNSSINLHVPETTEVTTSKGNFKRLQDAGVEDPLDVNLTAYKAIVGLCIVTALLAGAGIWIAHRLHKGTDLVIEITAAKKLTSFEFVKCIKIIVFFRTEPVQNLEISRGRGQF